MNILLIFNIQLLIMIKIRDEYNSWYTHRFFLKKMAIVINIIQITHGL